MTPPSGPCLLKINGINYQIGIEGLIIIKATESNEKKVPIDLPEHFYIESVQYIVFENNVIFTFEITDDESGSTLVSLFNPKSSKFEWIVELFAFNPSPLLISGKSIYLGGIGTITKLDLITGHTVWKHNCLYERETQAFNSFLKPIKEGNIIVLTEKKVSNAKYKGIREVRVNDITGEIVSK